MKEQRWLGCENVAAQMAPVQEIQLSSTDEVRV